MSKEIRTFNNVINSLSNDLKSLLYKIENKYKENIEEIRLRNGNPLNIYAQGRDYFISPEGKVLKDHGEALIVNHAQIINTFQLITNHSVYAYSEEIKKGFITIYGGHRVGLGGKIVYGSNGIENITNLSSLNIRIAREKKGISNLMLSYLIHNKYNFLNTLIISPPQCGKTTLLRDLVRNLSNGIRGVSKGFKVSLVDERSEIAGLYNSKAQNDIGIRTDVLDGCFKADGIIMLIRAMSPEIIAVDEIGGSRDIEAIDEGLRAGIGFIATIHGNDLEDIKARGNLSKLMDEKVFKRYIVLDRSRGVGTIKAIIEGESFKNIYPEVKVHYASD